MQKTRRRIPLLVKIVIGLVLVAGLGALFMRSARDARATPYTTRAADLTGWTLVSDTGSTPESAAVMLQASRDFTPRLFRQIFSRAAESLNTPNTPGIALALTQEIGTALTADELLALAREAGLDRAAVKPVCLGYRRESQVGRLRQLYFVLVDLPEFGRFRQLVAARLRASGATSSFDPGALSPVMLIAAQPDFTRWLPFTATAPADCVAPLVVE